MLYAIDSVGSQFGRPSKEVVISDCGQLFPKHHTSPADEGGRKQFSMQ